ncbi:MAG: ATP-dependent Clp protease proteolytic subunit [Candidatus Peribacter sp.]|nr:ATP-dependent Clp protease proteolytic subunit [Candidatus Peribacter sp.]
MLEKLAKNKKKDKETDLSKQIVIVNNIDGAGNRADEIRTINLYSDITEKVCAEAVSALFYFKDTAVTYELKDPDNPDSEVIGISKPVSLVISTFGGSATDMFSVYDTMRMTKEVCDINTIGMGKVMSAGVLLLAAGTKGKRKIGANCRVMIHGVAGGFGGTLTTMENEIEEIKWIQEKYISCLAAETNLTVKRLKKMIRRQVDVYLSAEQAVEFGIADEII